MDDLTGDINKALQLAFDWGQVDGDHHKMWVIDQMVRALLGVEYAQWVKVYQHLDVDGEPQYEWDEGVAPWHTITQ